MEKSSLLPEKFYVHVNGNVPNTNEVMNYHKLSNSSRYKLNGKWKYVEVDPDISNGINIHDTTINKCPIYSYEKWKALTSLTFPSNFYVDANNGAYSDEIMNAHRIITVHPLPYQGFNIFEYVEIGSSNIEKLTVHHHATKTHIPVFTYEEWKFIYDNQQKQQSMNTTPTKEERKITGYKLTNPKLRNAVTKLVSSHCSFDTEKYDDLTLSVSGNPHSINELKELELLNIWFEPVYEEENPFFSVIAGTNNIELKVFKSGEIKADRELGLTKVADIKDIQVILEGFVGNRVLHEINSWTVSIPYEVKCIRVGCADENHLFSYDELSNIVTKFKLSQWDKK
jgi:hypothetical protein